jgi:hypothetical protein
MFTSLILGSIAYFVKKYRARASKLGAVPTAAATDLAALD